MHRKTGETPVDIGFGAILKMGKQTKKILSDVKTFYICPTINFQKNHYEQS